MFLKRILAILFAVLANLAQAKTPDVSVDEGGFVPIEQAQRVTMFDHYRVWSTVQGHILVCPLNQNECPKKKGEPFEPKGWIVLSQLKLEGFEISGFSHRFIGNSGNPSLLVYWRAKR